MVEHTNLQPNEYGVFTSFTEHIQYRSAAGAEVDVFLVDTAKGWLWGYRYAVQWSGAGANPSLKDTPYASRNDALHAAIDCVKRQITGSSCHTLTPHEIRQRQEIEHWCNTHRQFSLF